jgi:hypothetical protein
MAELPCAPYGKENPPTQPGGFFIFSFAYEAVDRFHLATPNNFHHQVNPALLAPRRSFFVQRQNLKVGRWRANAY